MMYPMFYSIIKHLSIAFNMILQTIWYVPLFKARCNTVGKNLSLPKGIPFIAGHAHIIIGNNVTLNKISIGTSAVIDKPSLSIGNNTVIRGKSTIGASLKIRIGNNCIIEDNFLILDTDGHPLNSQLRRKRKLVPRNMLKPTIVGDNVYIGRNVSVLKGVFIGNHSVILPNTLVIKDIPQNSIVCGVPAQIISLRK